MLNPRYFREDINEAAEKLRKRGYELDVKTITTLEKKRKALQVDTETLQSKRNSISKSIGQAKSKGEDSKKLFAKVGKLNDQLDAKKSELEKLQLKLLEIQNDVPNIPHESVPEGESEKDNPEIRKWGKLREFKFEPKDHIELGTQLNNLDFDVASKITGARFAVLYGSLARLQRALIQFMLDYQTEKHGYQEIYVPYIVNGKSLYGTGQLPKFDAELFRLEGKDDYWLTPTAEVPVTNIVRDKIIDAEDLPLKFACHTPCFRSEAGSYGKDVRGLIRQHQFEKVEMVWICNPKDSYDALEEITRNAETILQKLNIPYRVIALCSGDLGFGAAKTYDLELWLPGQNAYREISSCSNYETFQSRRMKARWRNPETGKPELVHTLNGSGLAVGRTLIAIMENYQDEKGQIHVPEVLRPYMGGLKLIQ